MFVLNPDGQELEEALYTLDLGDATAGVYLIATNTAGHEVDPAIERLDPEDGAAGRRAAVQTGSEARSRPAPSARVAEFEWITEFNNNPPLSGRRGFSGMRSGASAQAQRGVAEGDRYEFRHRGRDLVSIPATARSVVTDGETTVALWVADQEWGADCSGGGPCVTGEMVDALAERFLRPGDGNDIHDWVTAIYGRAVRQTPDMFEAPSPADGDDHPDATKAAEEFDGLF